MIDVSDVEPYVSDDATRGGGDATAATAGAMSAGSTKMSNTCACPSEGAKL